MESWLTEFAHPIILVTSAFWSTLRETAPFLTLGLCFAGILHVLVPSQWISWILGSTGWKGALKGAFVGAPLPLCSCSVIPTALALRKQGASLSSTAAFTISTPETSIDAIVVTFAMLPMAFVGLRPVFAIILSVFVGVIVEIFSQSTKEQLRQSVLEFHRKEPAPHAAEKCDDDCDDHVLDPATCKICGLIDPKEHQHGVHSKIIAVARYAFDTFFRDIAFWLFVGLFIAAIVQVVVPENGLTGTWFEKHRLIQILLAILVGIPMYSCATATTPMVAVLLVKGIDPGAAIALLLSGPATNLGNVFILRRELGTRSTIAYYASLFIGCFVIGWCTSIIWPWLSQFPALTNLATDKGHTRLGHFLPGIVEVLSAWILIGLAAKVFIESLFQDRHSHGGHHH